MGENLGTWHQRLARWRGSTVEHDLDPYAASFEAIERAGPGLAALDDETLRRRATALRRHATALGQRADHGSPLDELVVDAFALAREASHRTLGMRPFDVQVLAGLAMHRGRVVEMETGEGKTLAAVLPTFLAALEGRGAHVLTFNDYLARRDAEWMGPAYCALGVSVAFVQDGMDATERRAAYAADITYVTAKEAGFDLLRDLLATSPEQLTHPRPFHYALVDEADSLLIDEARVPLVIAGSTERADSNARRLAALVTELEPGTDYDTDEYDRNVGLTDAGLDHAEAALGCDNLLDEDQYPLFTELNCALHAHVLLRRDADYIVRDGRVELVDEFTGRVVENRHWPDGLQAALEAKEGLERGSDGRILGSITLQHFLEGYPRLCGMTGTAQDAAKEIEELYDLGVTVIPTHRPRIRIDQPDRVYTHRTAKEEAVVEEVRAAHERGRPVLVGTSTVAESERLARLLHQAKVECAVLNARQDAHEAEIVAGAGALGAVTIATNMAGRGTDIRLGGANGHDHGRVAELGGLYVIGTNRHESRRVDLQLRGRAGRQGDPGESRFFLSLEDDLLVRYGIRELIPPRFYPEPGSEPVANPAILREVARGQRIVEGQNLEIRKTLWRYAAPLEEQRQELHSWRQDLLLDRTAPEIWHRRPDLRTALVDVAGEDAVCAAEKALTLARLDRGWSEYLSFVADLREGNHLVGLGGEDPLTRFKVETAEAFGQMREDVEHGVLEALENVEASTEGLARVRQEIKGPSSTWTYLINDDPFRNQLGMLLTGPGKATMGIGAALFAPIFLVMWALVDRFAKKRPKRRPGAEPRQDPPDRDGLPPPC